MTGIVSRGFVIHDMMEFFRVTVFDLDSSIPLEIQPYCPACEAPLETLAALMGNDGKQRIRLGFCPKCGYIGYIDRPTKDWMVNFYANVWDTHIAKSVAEVRTQPLLVQEKKSSRLIAVRLAETLGVAKDRPVCEIGSGYGSVLKYFQDIGFSKVYGTENSEHRAKIVSEAYNLSVFAGNFEGEKVQHELKRVAPIGLFFSHHVFEHVYHPAEVIKSISSLQREGDYVVLALPNSIGEHAGYELFYLPHLHSFSKESLELLLNRFGYEVVAESFPTADNMIFAFRKVASPRSKFALCSDYRKIVSDKFISGLGLSALGNRGLFEYRWLVAGRSYNDSEMIPTNRVAWYLEKAIMFIGAKFKRFTSAHIFLVRPLKKKITDALIEIQFPERIKLLMK